MSSFCFKSRSSIDLVSLIMAGFSGLVSQPALAVDLASHKAIYDIRMKSATTGAQVLDVRGKMLYSFKKSCDGWISDHKFSLDYEYAGTPPVKVESKFTSFEKFDGSLLNFSSNRLANGEPDQELRGIAKIASEKAIYSIPSDLSFDLSKVTMFPAKHTVKLIDAAKDGKKIVNATVFDGSDDQGPVEINAVIIKKLSLESDIKLDKDLIGKNGWLMRLAVFPKTGDDNQVISDYEMTMALQENGIIRDMVVDYHNFSISQKLVAIEPIQDDVCGAE